MTPYILTPKLLLEACRKLGLVRPVRESRWELMSVSTRERTFGIAWNGFLWIGLGSQVWKYRLGEHRDPDRFWSQISGHWGFHIMNPCTVFGFYLVCLQSREPREDGSFMMIFGPVTIVQFIPRLEGDATLERSV